MQAEACQTFAASGDFSRNYSKGKSQIFSWRVGLALLNPLPIGHWRNSAAASCTSNVRQSDRRGQCLVYPLLSLSLGNLPRGATTANRPTSHPSSRLAKSERAAARAERMCQRRAKRDLNSSKTPGNSLLHSSRRRWRLAAGRPTFVRPFSSATGTHVSMEHHNRRPTRRRLHRPRRNAGRRTD